MMFCNRGRVVDVPGDVDFQFRFGFPPKKAMPVWLKL